eukprot:scpid59612/ scgid32873/ 
MELHTPPPTSAAYALSGRERPWVLHNTMFYSGSLIGKKKKRNNFLAISIGSNSLYRIGGAGNNRTTLDCTRIQMQHNMHIVFAESELRRKHLKERVQRSTSG